MSLGFLTESALLPSKAKAIKVDSKSLVDLKAVVFQKEQERQERKRQLEHALHGDDDEGDADGSTSTTGTGHRGFGKYARLKATKKRGGASLSREEEQVGRSSNPGIEKRRKRDEDAQELLIDEHDDKAWHKKSAEMLKKKAKVYEEMMHGRSDASGAGSGSAVVSAECLVDFDAKKRSSVLGGKAVVATSSESSSQVEITDEFGRVRFVASGSAAHSEFLRSRAGDAADGTPSSRLSREAVVGARAAQPSDQRNGGSFVVSQWEKRFNSQEKTYLQEVHEGVNQAKSALLDKQRRKQLRLEKLKRQAEGRDAAQQPTAEASSMSGVNPQEEQAAAMQATEFLSQLGSLM